MPRAKGYEIALTQHLAGILGLAAGGHDARRLRALENENAKLKKLLAEQMLDNAILRDVAAKNGSARRQTGSGGLYLCLARGKPASGVPGIGGGSFERALS